MDEKQARSPIATIAVPPYRQPCFGSSDLLRSQVCRWLSILSWVLTRRSSEQCRVKYMTPETLWGRGDTGASEKSSIQCWLAMEFLHPPPLQPRTPPTSVQTKFQQPIAGSVLGPQYDLRKAQSCLWAMVPITKHSRGCRSKLRVTNADATDLDQGLPHLQASTAVNMSSTRQMRCGVRCQKKETVVIT